MARKKRVQLSEVAVKLGGEINVICDCRALDLSQAHHNIYVISSFWTIRFYAF